MDNNDILRPLPYAYYSQKYEEYFNKVKDRGFKISELKVSEPYSEQDFIHRMHETMRLSENQLFSSLMRMEWMDRQIIYRGKKKTDYGPYGSMWFKVGVKFFYEHLVGFSRKFWTDGTLYALRGYADDFFPDLDKMDGFNEPFAYPYQYMRLACLSFVHKLKYRIDFLEEGERCRLTLPKFMDYVAAWATDVNVKHERHFRAFYSALNYCSPYMNEKLTLLQKLEKKKLTALKKAKHV